MTDTVTFSDLETHGTLELSDLGKNLQVISGCFQLSEPEVRYVPDDFVVEVIEQPMDHHKRGLSYTATGYGRKIPSTKVALCADNRKRRVYVAQFSNVGCPFIVVGGVEMSMDRIL